MKLGFIGMGNMAKALLFGLKRTERDLVSYAYAPTREKLDKNAREIGFEPVYDLKNLVKVADTVVMACKPYQIEKVLAEIRGLLEGKILVSLALGWDFERYNNILKNVKIQCIMPNIPVYTSEGVILFEESNSLSEDEKTKIVSLFNNVGKVITLPSNLMGIGSAISGCGPAFVYMFIEAYADAAVKYGIKRELAYELVSQTLAGSAKLQLLTGKHPGELKDNVCSPAGSTIKGVTALEKEGLRRACQISIDEIMRNG